MYEDMLNECILSTDVKMAVTNFTPIHTVCFVYIQKAGYVLNLEGSAMLSKVIF